MDGLCPTHLHARAMMVVQSILKHMPDVVSLQEVVLETDLMLRDLLGGVYHFVGEATREGYYILTLVRVCDDFYIDENSPGKIEYCGAARSHMGRDLLCVNLVMSKGGQVVTLYNSHMESCKGESVPIRTAQLAYVYSRMLDSNAGAAILSGDLNMRQAEQKSAMKTVASNGRIVDCFEYFGRPTNAAQTWKVPEESADPSMARFKCRFDRVYHNSKDVAFVSYENDSDENEIKMLGTKKQKVVGSTEKCYPSDHFGMLIKFVLTSPARDNWKEKDLRKKSQESLKSITSSQVSKKVGAMTKHESPGQDNITQKIENDRKIRRNKIAEAAEKRLLHTSDDHHERNRKIRKHSQEDIIDLT